MKIRTLIIALLGITPFMSNAQDTFHEKPVLTYDQRRGEALDFNIKYGMKEDRWGIFRIISQVAAGTPVEEQYIVAACKDVYRNRDCTDFTIHGLLRLRYLDKEKPLMSTATRKEVDRCLTDYKYWWDDGRKDTTYRCYHTENHQALYHSAEYLAGQLYANEKFTNGQTGDEHLAHALPLLERWMEFRFRFGFSEWLSTYYEVDIMLLANLYDFAKDEKIKTRAAILLDLLLFDMAQANYKGIMATTSGRIYAHSLMKDTHTLSPVTKLVFGEGIFLPGEAVMGTSTLATSRYKCPKIIQEIALATDTDFYNLQKQSIEVGDAEKYGLSYDNELDCHLFWGMQEFIHPQAVKMSKKISERYDVWPYRNYNEFIRRYEKQLIEHGKIETPYLDRFALSEANIIIYRRPEYIASSVQSYRPGALGYQQHPWHVAFDRNAKVFTNYPGSLHLKGSPNYWAGTGRLPRVAQYKNVIITLYDIPQHEKFNFTHAHFPKKDFDRVVEKNGWIFGQNGDGYVALYSRNGYSWKMNDAGVVNDVVADGKQNIWVCELGTKREFGSFEKFIKKIIANKITCDGLNVAYNSTLYGNMEFGWTGDFLVKDKKVPLRFDYRYENPYCKAKFDAPEIIIRKDGKELYYNYKGLKRKI